MVEEARASRDRLLANANGLGREDVFAGLGKIKGTDELTVEARSRDPLSPEEQAQLLEGVEHVVRFEVVGNIVAAAGSSPDSAPEVNSQ